MTTKDIASRLVDLCRKGAFVQAEEELYDPDVVHVETTGLEWKGFDDVLMKEKQFLEQLTSKPLVEVSDPIVAGNFFSIRMHMEFTHTQRGHQAIDEIIIYKVQDGRITYLRCYSSN